MDFSQYEIERARYAVASAHHVRGNHCLCGYASYVARDRTEHILDEFLKELNRSGDNDRIRKALGI